MPFTAHYDTVVLSAIPPRHAKSDLGNVPRPGRKKHCLADHINTNAVWTQECQQIKSFFSAPHWRDKSPSTEERRLPCLCVIERRSQLLMPVEICRNISRMFQSHFSCHTDVPGWVLTRRVVRVCKCECGVSIGLNGSLLYQDLWPVSSS